MDGKTEGQADSKAWPILLFVNDLAVELRQKLVEGLAARDLNYDIFDYKHDPTMEATGPVAYPKVAVAAGIDAFKSARLGLQKQGTVIYTIPEPKLFLEDKRLAPIVAEHLRFVQTSVLHREALDYPPESSSTSPSIPTTSIASTPSTGEFDPRDSGISLPTEGLTKDELLKLFESQFSEDPFVFWSGKEEVAIYLGEPQGKMPIEFSLEEFFTILKLTELTKAKAIIWREPDASA